MPKKGSRIVCINDCGELTRVDAERRFVIPTQAREGIVFVEDNIHYIPVAPHYCKKCGYVEFYGGDAR